MKLWSIFTNDNFSMSSSSTTFYCLICALPLSVLLLLSSFLITRLLYWLLLCCVMLNLATYWPIVFSIVDWQQLSTVCYLWSFGFEMPLIDSVGQTKHHWSWVWIFQTQVVFPEAVGNTFVRGEREYSNRLGMALWEEVPTSPKPFPCMKATPGGVISLMLVSHMH